MSNIFQSIKAMITKHQQQVSQKQFLEAVMGTCALLALADDDITFSELMARDYLLDNVQALQLFDANEAAEIFRLKAEALQNNYQQEKEIILQSITSYADHTELAPLFLQICLVIAQADTTVTNAEQQLIDEVKQVLHLDSLDK